MRLPPTLLASRTPQREKIVPFQERLPLKLKNSVSGKADSTNDVACLQEMSIVFACLKNNDFNESLCSKELSTFQRCYKSFLDKKSDAKKVRDQGILTPGKNINSKQLNKLFKMHPNK